MTVPLFHDDAYLRTAPARVVALTAEGGIVLDRSLFYATAGGQPGDSGHIEWAGGKVEIATAIKGDGGAIILVPAGASALPAPGTELAQAIDWNRRLGHMRVHTALHLLSVAVPFPVTGGQIGDGRGRLDFDIAGEVPAAITVEGEINRLIALNLPVGSTWIAEEELDRNPGLVKTLSVGPPRGQGRIRLVRIGEGTEQIDLQPCGGTHVANTGEIGTVRILKVENKGRQNRRISLALTA